jgi:hypothetical protein
VAVTGFREKLGTSTEQSNASADAASNALTGASANQSMCGVSIENE